MNASSQASSPWRPPFTPSQWQELEQQALIFKYLMAGIPVPPDLVVPIRTGLHSLSPRFLHHASLYGKKLDPEPGRCRRTDGKKWRCSKDAYPDSKYCERHMHRGRNRSRKPVEEPQPQPQPQSLTPSPSSSSPSSTVTSLAGGAPRSAAPFAGPCLNQIQLDLASQRFSRPPQPPSWSGFDYGESAKQDNQNSRSFFDSWSELDGGAAMFPGTQLSISTPVVSSDFSTASSRSPNDERDSLGA